MEAGSFALVDMALPFGGLLLILAWQYFSVRRAMKARLEREAAAEAVKRGD